MVLSIIEEIMKIGIIGLGHMGGFHASASSLLSGVTLVGVADPNEQNWQKVKTDGVIKTKDYNDWLDQVDGVIIATPTDFHYSIAKDCLQKGKHVLLEKPLTKTVQEGEELFKIAQAKKLALHVGHVERFNGAVQELKKFIDAPLLIECHRMGPFSPRVQKDSVVLDLMIHDLDIVIGLVDSPLKSWDAQGVKVHSDSCDIAIVQLGFENGTIANIVSSRASQIKKRTMTVHQKDAFINLDFSTQDLSIYRRTSSSVNVGQDQIRYKQETTIEQLFVHKDNPLKLEIQNFVTSAQTGVDLINPEQDLQALRLVFEIEKRLGVR